MRIKGRRRKAGERLRGGRTALCSPAAFGFLFLTFCLVPSVFCLPPPSPAPAAASNNNGGRQTYDSFRLVHTRNVFDPDRRPIRPVGASGPAPAPTRADYVALTGIAMDGDHSLAFFSGSREEFNRVIPVSDHVAGATITKITPMNVEVDRNGRHLVINVGQTVPLDDKSLPANAPTDQPAASTAPSAVPGAPAAPGAASSTTLPARVSASGAPASSANLDEIRRRMMERHNQDQK